MSEFNQDQQNDKVEVVQTFVDPTPEGPVAQNKGFAIASLILGIVAIVPGCCCTVFGMIILGILAIVFAILFNKANPTQVPGKGMAKAGLILGIVAIVLAVLLFIAGLVLGDSFQYTTDFDTMYEDIMDDLE